MLARRHHGRVEAGRDQHVEHRIAREVAGLPVVVGAFHPLHRIGKMQIAPVAGAVVGQRWKFWQTVERDVHLAGRAADFVTGNGVDKILRQNFRIDKAKERALRVATRHNRVRPDFLTTRKHNAARAAATDLDTLDFGTAANFAAGRPHRARNRIRHRAHAAPRKTPGPDRPVHVAHVVVQQDVGGARRIGSERGADDAGDGQVSLDHVVFEILVQEFRDRHREEADGVAHFLR